MQVRRSRRIARGVPLDDVHLRPGRPQLETLPLQNDDGFFPTPKTRSLPWSIDEAILEKVFENDDEAAN